MADNNNQVKIKKIVSLAFMAISAVFVVVVLAQITAFAFTPVGNDDYSTMKQADKKSEENKTPIAQTIAQTLKAKNMFVPTPKPRPPREVKGIFGQEALINGKWYKVGDTVPPGAKVISIEACQVTIEWEGKEIVLAPIKAASSRGPGKKPKKKEKPENKKPSENKNETIQKPVQEAKQEDVPKKRERRRPPRRRGDRQRQKMVYQVVTE